MRTCKSLWAPLALPPQRRRTHAFPDPSYPSLHEAQATHLHGQVALRVCVREVSLPGRLHQGVGAGGLGLWISRCTAVWVNESSRRDSQVQVPYNPGLSVPGGLSLLGV